MKILFLSDNFPPETNAPANRTGAHCRLWVAGGHEVTVITTAPNFPAGEVFSGYRNAWRAVEDWHGVRVVRVKSYIAANQGRLRRTLDYLSFMGSGTLAALRETRPDVIVATSPQFFAACAGGLTSLMRDRPFVFELRDLWPESISAVGALQQGWTLRQIERIELALYARAARIVTVSPGFIPSLTRRGVDPAKIVTVTNGVELEAFQPRPRDEALARAHGLEGKFTLGYIGTHGMAHGLDRVLDAARYLSAREDIRFLFVGGGAERDWLEARARAEGIANAVFLPPQPREAMPAIWSLCDAALIALRDQPTFAGVIPSKIFEAMAMGLAQIVALPEGVATDLVKGAGAGLAVAPEDPAALAEAVVGLADDPGRVAVLGAAGLAAAPAYDRTRLAREMLAELEAVVREAG